MITSEYFCLQRNFKRKLLLSDSDCKITLVAKAKSEFIDVKNSKERVVYEYLRKLQASKSDAMVVSAPFSVSEIENAFL